MEATLCIFFAPGSKPEPEKQGVGQASALPKLEERLFCAQCRHVITSQKERITVQDSHEHTCTNPYGITFHIACFREAPGCAMAGIGTTADTWFAGYAWRIALCSNCGINLGWEYASQSDGFYGLIVNRLTTLGPETNPGEARNE